ncbi:sensor histidine kinase [Streptomyces sp. DSM 40750]|uniref:sensor histidine kinase n=1 Tax=Streptomyces sp. DSM 40750 TaxID=2801030 RepID=UPI00214B0E64|nr:histidine kinase [Streptomyces sp. DSM 40750]UUU21574.1 histidine kinase [Streptomyces sp. DSM 40750]
MSISDLPVRFPQRLSRRQLVGLDATAALAYLVVFLLPVVITEESGAARVPLWVRCVLVAGAGIPLAARRLWPRPVFAVVLMATLLQLLLGLAVDPFAAAAYALYPLALTTTSQRLIPTPAVAVACTSVVLLGMVAGSPHGWQNGIGFLVVGTALLGAVWTAGFAVRGRRALARVEAARREEQAVHHERLRIARELHDIVTHSMGLITVKASIANHVLPSRPEEAHDALKVIETISREAMTEMRGILHVLRIPPADEPDAETDAEPADLDPTPGLADVPALVRRAEHAGVRVDLTMSRGIQVPDGVGLAAYRIVQEALTNVLNHAAPTSCMVRIEATAADLRVEVRDEGPPAPDPGRRTRTGGNGGGHGITGMRERAMMYGGTLTAAPHPDGGFRVTACLPYPPAREKPRETQ